MQSIQSRRRFLTNLSLASAAAIVGAPKSLHAEPPPETTTVRLAKGRGAVCAAAEYLPGELLRAEGLTDARYVVPDWDKKMQQRLVGVVGTRRDRLRSQLCATHHQLD